MMPKSRHESGAAEMIGALALIALFVAAIAIIAVVLFSQPAPEKIPALSMIISNQSRIIEISHEGGEALPFDEMEVMVDGVPVASGTTPGTWSCTDCGTDFSVGDRLLIDYDGVPEYLNSMPYKVDIVYKKEGLQHQLLTTRYLGTMTPTPTPITIPTTATASPTPTVTTTTPPVSPPVAQFSGEPVTGTSPHTVVFTDLSTNAPTTWLWDFGDGDSTNATSQNPVHTYAAAGTYYVNLTATNTAGSDYENKTAYITVTTPATMDIYLNADKPSNLITGGYLQFIVSEDRWSPYIIHGSVRYNLNEGDVVRLVIGSDTKGQIYATSSRLSTFSFDDVQLYINGDDKGSGTVSTIWVRGYSDLVSTLTLDVPWQSAWTRFDVNGVRIINGADDSRIQVFNLKVSGNVMNLDNQATTYYDGGADAYLITPASVIPVAGFTGTPTTGGRPLTVQFTDTSTNTPTSWLWDFGDTSFVNYTAQNPVHTFANAGNYTITLTATNTAGSDTYARNDYIQVNTVSPPAAGFTGNPTSGTGPLSVAFTDTSTNTPTSWLWDFGDGNTTGSTLRNPVHLYSSAGTYTVSLTATNSGGSGSLTRTDYITVTILPPVADFSGTPTSGTEPLTVTFTDTSTNTPTTWLWDFGDGNTSTEQNPVHQYISDGRYNVRLTSSNSGGSDSETKNNYITVNRFTADFTYTYTSFWFIYYVDFTDASTGTPVSWSWDFADGSGSTTVQNPEDVVYWFGGNRDVTLTVTNSVGTIATVTKRIRLS